MLNTVGKSGKLGEHIRCVVSVSILTEGWNANTVTHILGMRAFGTQLLCEQVVGRGLRRISYTPTVNQINVNGKNIEIESFTPEYAEVYGVPFAFIPCAGSNKQPKRGALPTRVRALPERNDCEITFPRLLGYRYEIKSQKLTPDFNKPGCKYSLSTNNGQVYVVQTAPKFIQRCILMTTDPGDLVLDPTMGSGSTAYVAEQWGRRWITIDTSRVALALARTRLMSAQFPYYLLADSTEGIKKETEITTKLPPTNIKTENDI
ncbi:MAG: DNA methyltransferase, partial [Cyanobacteria bacterium J06628_3]